jgi:hypothetical protein
MEQFQPAQPSLWKQLWMSPVVLIGLTLAVVMASVIFIRQKQAEEIANRAELLRSGPVMVEPSSEAAAAPKAEGAAPVAPPVVAAETPAPAVAAAVTNAASSLPATAGVKPMAANVAEAAPVPEAKPESRKAAAATSKIVMTATYAEVPKAVLQQMVEDAQSTGQFTNFGDFGAGALGDVSSRTQGVKVLQRVSKTFDGKTNSMRWFVGGKTPDGQEVGLTTLVTLQPSTDGHTHGEVELLRALRETNESDEIVRKTYPISSFDLAPHSGWMIHLGDLPRQVAQPAGEEIGTEGFLRLFQLGTFKNSESEFTLFLDFDSSNP